MFAIIFTIVWIFWVLGSIFYLSENLDKILEKLFKITF